MNIRVGFIPYLNMVPFHQGFGPGPVEIRERRFEFKTVSPHALGLEAEAGTVDAGALSLVDLIRLAPHFEPLGNFGVGVRQAAHSVLFFSKKPIGLFSGMCAVTDESSTSYRLLQVLLEVRHARPDVRYGRIASHELFDGEADGLLLIGDEALRAQAAGVPGFPHVADLGEEWHQWQGLPFVFARWAVRQALRQEVKDIIEISIEKSLLSTESNMFGVARQASATRGLTADDAASYWAGFDYRLTDAHEESIRIFTELLEKQCSIV